MFQIVGVLNDNHTAIGYVKMGRRQVGVDYNLHTFMGRLEPTTEVMNNGV